MMLMKKTAALLLAILLPLTVSCGSPEPVQASAPASAPAPVSQADPAVTQIPVPGAVPDLAADRYDQVFDVSGDKGRLTVRFLKLVSANPGEKSGDSAILTFPDGKVMLIDAGNPTCAPIVKDALEAMGVTKLDAVVNSHPHADHCGGLRDILNDIPVDMVYKGSVVYPKGNGKIFEDTLAENKLPVTILTEGDEFSFGGAEIKVYNPPKEIDYPAAYPEDSTWFVNNNSLLLHITYGGSTMLFGGDLYTPGESRLVEEYGDRLQADVVKANHHGDDTSNSPKYIKATAPAICVMMHDNVANMNVYKAYCNAGASTYLTFADGCVKVSADNARNYTVVTQFDRQDELIR